AVGGRFEEPRGVSRDPGGELVDVLDDAGRPVATVTRGEMRARRLPHGATYVLVFNRRGELFVHLRSPDKDVYPGHWDVAIGGVLAAGESFDEGARREAREELGVALEPEPLFPLRWADEQTVVHGMVYRARHDGPFRLQPEELDRGEMRLGFRAYTAARIGTEKMGGSDDPLTFPNSAAGHLRQHRYFLELKLDHDVRRLAKTGWGLARLFDWIDPNTLKYSLQYR